MNDEWNVGQDTNNKVFIQSEDFTHDVRLYVNGDFYSSEENISYANKISLLLNNYESLQAKIDSLMLEYCPNEMTKEQISNWERHQVLVESGDL